MEKPILRRRSESERGAYIQGFEAGAKAAIEELRRQNQFQLIEQIESRLKMYLEAVQFTPIEAEEDGMETKKRWTNV